MTLADAYLELEVDLGAPREAVQQGRKILLRVWHPDRHQQDPKLRAAAEKKTARINAAYDVIEAAGFPGPEAIPPDSPHANATAESSASERESIDQQIRLRELELREREIALQEKLASKPSTTEWIDKRAAQLTRGTMAVALVGAVVLINLVVVLWLIEARRFMQPMPMFWCVIILTASTAWLLARFQKTRLARTVVAMGLTAVGFALLTSTGILGTDQQRLSVPAIVLLAAVGGAGAEWVRTKLYG